MSYDLGCWINSDSAKTKKETAMSNQKKVIDLKPATEQSIREGSQEFFNDVNSGKDVLAALLGRKWSATSDRYVLNKEAKAVLSTDDLRASGNPQKYGALVAGYIAANDERFGARFAGFTLAEISAMDRDAVREYKLGLADGNKKPQTKAQIAAVKKFTDAQASARNKISTGMATLRDTADTILGVTSRKAKKAKTQNVASAPTASGTDSTTGNVLDSEVESGSVTEADGILPPAIRDPRLLKMFNTVAQYDLTGQARFAEVMIIAMKAFDKE